MEAVAGADPGVQRPVRGRRVDQRPLGGEVEVEAPRRDDLRRVAEDGLRRAQIGILAAEPRHELPVPVQGEFLLEAGAGVPQMAELGLRQRSARGTPQCGKLIDLRAEIEIVEIHAGERGQAVAQHAALVRRIAARIVGIVDPDKAGGRCRARRR